MERSDGQPLPADHPDGEVDRREGEVIRLDGGLATTLEASGADLSTALWSAALLADAPERIVAAHAAFLDAGAKVLRTASYQLSAEGLRRAGRDPTDEGPLLARSVELAREAIASRGGHALVVGSLGPWGAVLGGGREYVGRYDEDGEQLARFHAPRLRALAEAGADVILFETIPAAAELAAIADVVADTGLRVWVTATTAPSGDATPEGTPLLAAFEPLLEHGEVAAIGVNCVPVDRVVPALRTLAPTGRPLVAAPNAGDRYIAGRGWVPRSTGGPSADARPWVRAGATAVGGCCGTGPAALHHLLSTLDRAER